ncbi:glycine zipper 2TM domain-containing protein [Massilia sp. Dwa41.01b]|uniref:glycine zipper 2TM domain-containing protein n=1 Tax=unclassified Massilia TaxID=2609279 RepID=UPI0015FF400E|nr:MULTISPECIES: glycine zipper 2TM domain-containing protein [unclassified Massilia]QNA90738.1 glycine zipper 2TM domain-containing protein [Massilia sp. Dwa41.01b]QNA97975.1 glycine zipper 2TM domain-containing protein [Massilia sp. Se16.2.3]
MNMPLNNDAKRRTHPVVLAAGSAVVLVCLVGTAAIMGWLPTSAGATAEQAALALAQPAAVSPDKPARQAGDHAAPRHLAAAPVVYRQPRAEPVRRTEAPVCQNCGTVASIREINTRGDGSGLGAAGGAVVGGLLGNQVGGGHGKEAMTVVGAIGGAFAGNQIEKRARATQSYETTIHMNNGSTRTVAQTVRPEWHDGDQVKIVNGIVQMRG